MNNKQSKPYKQRNNKPTGYLARDKRKTLNLKPKESIMDVTSIFIKTLIHLTSIKEGNATTKSLFHIEVLMETIRRLVSKFEEENEYRNMADNASRTLCKIHDEFQMDYEWVITPNDNKTIVEALGVFEALTKVCEDNEITSAFSTALLNAKHNRVFGFN